MLATVDMYMANIEQSDNMIALHNLSVNTKKQLLKEPGKFNVQVFYKIIDKKVMPCKRVTYPPSRASLLRSRGGGLLFPNPHIYWHLQHGSKRAP